VYVFNAQFESVLCAAKRVIANAKFYAMKGEFTIHYSAIVH